MGQVRTQFVPSHPSTGQRDRYQFHGAAQAPSATQTGQRGQGIGLDQDFQACTSGTQGHVYVVVLQTELADQSDIHGTF